MLFHDASGDGKPKSRAVFLGGEKRVEKSLFDLRRNPAAIVRNLQHYNVGLAINQPFAVMAGAQRNRPAHIRAIGGVLNQIDQHLL